MNSLWLLCLVLPFISLHQVLAHPFLSGRKVARMVGEKPKFDVFLSYRVDADGGSTVLKHVEKLYHLLIAKGLTVWWDAKCLLKGEDWEQGFCEGLVNSRTFVPLWSRSAINHPTIAWQNFSHLTIDQPRCDNVFLEHRLAIELQGLGLIEKVFPVLIGDVNPGNTPSFLYYPQEIEITFFMIAKCITFATSSNTTALPYRVVVVCLFGSYWFVQ